MWTRSAVNGSTAWIPTAARPGRESRKGCARDVDRAVTAASQAMREGPWSKLTASARGKLHAEARRPRRRQRRPTGRNRSPRQRQAARRDARPARLSPRMVALLRWPGRQDRRRRRADRQAGHVRLHAARADGRRGGADGLEFAAAVHRLEVCAGDRGRLHRRGEAVRVRVGLDARIRGAHQGGRLSRRRVQRRHGLRRRKPARRWSTTPASRRSPSPAPTRPAPGSTRRRPRP